MIEFKCNIGLKKRCSTIFGKKLPEICYFLKNWEKNQFF